MMADDLYWDPYDYDLHRDPHPVWGRMMTDAPLYRNEQLDFWAMTRFDDVLDRSRRLDDILVRTRGSAGGHPGRPDP